MNERVMRLRACVEAKGCDGFVSVFPPDNQYLSGFQTNFLEISSVILISRDQAHFLCDFRYTEQAQHEVKDFDITEIKGDQLVRAGERLTQMGLSTVALDPCGFTVDERARLASAYQGELQEHKDLVAPLRAVKTPDEVETIRAASALAEGVLADLVPTLETGLPERELAAQFEYEFKKRGATAASFDTIALFGPKSSLPHGEPSDKKLAPGDVVLLDFGCRLHGYCSDLTRTYAFGSMPGAWFEEIYDRTLVAQRAALDAVRPGMTGREVDAVARDIIRDGGFGEYFGHGLGHGVGIEIHEQPRLNAESDTVLEPGMIVTVEPGIYLPGKGGVRIEDLIVVTSEGCEILSRAPKELEVLPA